MEDRELWAEIVQSGTWLYDGQVLRDVWIVRQNFGTAYEGENLGARSGTPGSFFTMRPESEEWLKSSRCGQGGCDAHSSR